MKEFNILILHASSIGGGELNVKKKENNLSIDNKDFIPPIPPAPQGAIQWPPAGRTLYLPPFSRALCAHALPPRPQAYTGAHALTLESVETLMSYVLKYLSRTHAHVCARSSRAYTCIRTCAYARMQIRISPPKEKNKKRKVE